MRHIVLFILIRLSRETIERENIINLNLAYIPFTKIFISSLISFQLVKSADSDHLFEYLFEVAAVNSFR